jgi:hypothetical protein
MNFVTFDFIKKVAAKHNLKVWKIVDSSGEPIDKQESESIEPAESMEQLYEVYAGVVGEYVGVQLSPRKLKLGGDQISNVFKYKLKCLKQNDEPDYTAAPGRKAGAGLAGLSDNITSQLIALNVALAETKAAQKINELERQLAEAKAEKKNGKGKMLERYLEQMLLSASAPKVRTAPAPVADNHTENIASNFDQNSPAAPAGQNGVKNLAASLQKLKSVDSDFINSIESLAKFAEREPEQYRNYLVMLQNSLDSE